MLKNGLKLLLRTTRRELFISLAKVFGLSVGFAVFIAITLFVQAQLDYDSFHSKNDRIYRLNLLGSYQEAAGEEIAMSHYKMRPFLKANYPEIEEVIRIFDSTEGYCAFGEDKAYFQKALFVDSTFFNVFDFELLYGQKSTALQAPNSIIITESISKQLFGEEDPVGQQVAMRYGHWVIEREQKDREGVITGVIKEEDRSHLKFDALTSFATPSTLGDVNWSGPVVNTYLLLKEGSSAIALNKKLETFYKEYHEPLAEMYQPNLQQLSDVHLGSSHISWDPLNWKKFDRAYINICMLLGIIVLLVAAVNFVQLTVGQLNDRLKSTAIRKIVGSTNWNVLGRNYFETAIFNLVALIIAFFGIILLSPFLQSEFGINVVLDEIFEGKILVIIVGTILLVVGLAGIIPSLILKAIPVSEVIAGTNSMGGKSLLTKFLIVTQLSMSVGLLGGGIVIYNQIDFLLKSNDSFDQELVLQIPMSEESKKKYTTIKHEFERLSGVSNVTAASNAFGTIGGVDMKLKIDGEEKILIMPTLMVDPNFLDFYDIDVIEGSNFTEWGKNEFIVNQAWVDNFGWENPMEEQLGFAYGRPGKVVGVVDNFNYNSLHEEVESLCIWSTNFIKVISVKVAAGQMPGVFDQLGEVWSSQVSDSPFTYTFLNEDVAEMYKTEVTVGKVIRYLTLISIFLTAIGIYALSLLVSKRKTKEVSIKKVLGASISSLFSSYSFQFYKLILLAVLIASPVMYLVMKNWMQNFAYVSEIPTGYLIGGVIAIIVIGTLAIVSNLLKLVKSNPVKALREN